MKKAVKVAAAVAWTAMLTTAFIENRKKIGKDRKPITDTDMKVAAAVSGTLVATLWFATLA